MKCGGTSHKFLKRIYYFCRLYNLVLLIIKYSWNYDLAFLFVVLSFFFRYLCSLYWFFFMNVISIDCTSIYLLFNFNSQGRKIPSYKIDRSYWKWGNDKKITGSTFSWFHGYFVVPLLFYFKPWFFCQDFTCSSNKF